MAPLYKRYVPPKATVSSLPIVPAQKPPQSRPPAPDTSVPKRKRDRTEEEVAERKAKKLRKKGIDPDTLSSEPSTQSSKVVSIAADTVSPHIEPAQDSSTPPQGEFAHITNNKKRRKLEKEARRARIAAEKSQEGSEVTGGADSTDATEDSRQREREVNGDAEGAVSGTSDERRKTPKKQRKKDVGNAVEDVKRPKKSREDQDDQITEANDQIATLSQPKKRRHKLESVLHEPHQPLQDDSGTAGQYSKKDKAVLEKFQKSAERSKAAVQSETAIEPQAEEQPTLLDLAPLPQPEPAPIPEFNPDPNTLPAWLAKPEYVSGDVKTPFVDLKLDSQITERLSKLGFDDALPVQQSLIPLLLPPGSSGARFFPGTETALPDIAVSAPTGSGKTIAYLVPILESLKKIAGLGRLKALVIVPTRELVTQVTSVAESLARGSSIKIGSTTGTGNFKDEQSKLVKMGRRYDPEGYQKLMARIYRRNYPPTEDSDEFEDYLDEIEKEDPKDEKRLKDAVASLVEHVPMYDSAVDILVATPGRLLEHLANTLGFNLAYLEWLVLDEADKLLDQQYDRVLETVNEELSRPRSEEEQDDRERYLRSKRVWNEHRERRVRKVVLSATMTRDISQLVGLKLKRPRMIIVRGSEQEEKSLVNGTGDVKPVAGDDFELPPTLSEYCVPVGDGSEKPLYLIELLRARIVSSLGQDSNDLLQENEDNRTADAEVTKDTSDAESDSDSESNSDSSSDDSSDSLSSDSEIEVRSQSGDEDAKPDTAFHPERATMLDTFAKRQIPSKSAANILIFTSSTESANRLSHLLKALRPEWRSWIKTMTKSDGKPKFHGKDRTKDPIITISTDRASRGLDVINSRAITHVVQYDVPRSATGYVHRVGRTARAGRYGEAWTLYTHSEARWFLNEVTRSKEIKRREPVEKTVLAVNSDEMREELRKAVESMRDEVFGRGTHSK